MPPRIITVEAGLATTIQDFGRIGFQALGVPTAGALDQSSLRVANALVGNPEEMAALEIRILGPCFRVAVDSIRIALVGTAAPIEILAPVGENVPPRRSVRLTRGQVFRVGATADTACCYLAVEGGFDIAPVFGSRSTYTRGGFGGFEGRALHVGDSIPLGFESVTERPERITTMSLDIGGTGPIRIVLGPQSHYFSVAGMQTFLNSAYTISREADRMGLRLEGPVIEHALGYNIISDGIVTGSIQVPGTGKPIILLVDHQTTGGYPKVATVISADLPRLGRMRPGASLTFNALDVAEAERLRRALDDHVRQVIDTIALVPRDFEPSSHRLRSINLISGVIALGDVATGRLNSKE